MDYSKRRFVYVLICVAIVALKSFLFGGTIGDTLGLLFMFAIFVFAVTQMVSVIAFIVFLAVPSFLRYMGYLPDEYFESGKIDDMRKFAMGGVIGTAVICVSLLYPLYALLVG